MKNLLSRFKNWYSLHPCMFWSFFIIGINIVDMIHKFGFRLAILFSSLIILEAGQLDVNTVMQEWMRTVNDKIGELYNHAVEKELENAKVSEEEKSKAN